MNEADTERRKDQEEAERRERAAEIAREERLKKIAYMQNMPDATPAGTGRFTLNDVLSEWIMSGTHINHISFVQWMNSCSRRAFKINLTSSTTS